MKTILLIDDSRFLRVTNERTLVRADYRVITGCDGEDGFQQACDRVPGLILRDMLLPTLTGPEVLRGLKTTPQPAHVPIVVLSSLPQSNEPQLKKNGGTAYFDKSTLGLYQHSESLIPMVKRILDGQADFPGLGEPTLPVESEV